MQEPQPQTLIEEVAKAGADMTLSLRRVLDGFIKQKGGPEALGRELALMTEDDDINPSSQVSIYNNMLKLLSQLGGGEQNDDLLTPDQIVNRMKQLDAEMQEADGDAAP
jgi:hypothetical protein